MENIVEHRISSFADFHRIIEVHNMNWDNWFYRGENSLEHKLVPKAGRPHFSKHNLNESDLFEKWCRHAVAYLDQPIDNKWDLLAIAQHHGLATKLLDWTFNPMTAAFFAVNVPDNSIEEESESVIYAHFSERSFFNTVRYPDPFSINDEEALKDKVYRISARSVVPRIMRQSGIFTIHFPASSALDECLPEGDRLEKLIIDKSYRKQFTIELSHYGINKMSLFPDLDGLSSHINWSFLNLYS